ncbi:MAG: hypothetical protein JWP97_629 [Labilithrix sp.]|nr:hypothetical protein [Labilithrix sp.]
MNIKNARLVWKKMLPFAFGAVVLGTAGTALAHRYLGSECCAQGASCCHPGAACCNGAHKTAQR